MPEPQPDLPGVEPLVALTSAAAPLSEHQAVQHCAENAPLNGDPAAEHMLLTTAQRSGRELVDKVRQDARIAAAVAGAAVRGRDLATRLRARAALLDAEAARIDLALTARGEDLPATLAEAHRIAAAPQSDDPPAPRSDAQALGRFLDAATELTSRAMAQFRREDPHNHATIARRIVDGAQVRLVAELQPMLGAWVELIGEGPNGEVETVRLFELQARAIAAAPMH
jgi:hypothetical protein